MIYTSNFANIRNKIGEDFKFVGIVREMPSSLMKMKNIQLLAPSSMILKLLKKKSIDEEVFKEIYIRELNQIKEVDKLRVFLNNWNKKNQNLVLCCYEKSEEFCHRHILAEWIQEKFGIVVKELH